MSPNEQVGTLSLRVGDARQAKLDPGLQQLITLCAGLSYMDSTRHFGTCNEGSGESVQHAYAQTEQCLNCSYTQSVGVDKDTRSKSRLLASLDSSAWAFIGASFCADYMR